MKTADTFSGLAPESPIINIGGRLYDFDRPWVMGIINATPDSFYAGSRVDGCAVGLRAKEMLSQGADCLDVGACSTRPGAEDVSAEEEWRRLDIALDRIRTECPEAVLSVDTYRACVARRAVEEYGVDIINDISGGEMDPGMFDMVASLQCAYVLMHMRGTPKTMHSLTQYDDLTADIVSDLAFRAARLRELGVCDIILDPGFGFAKTVAQNYRLLDELPEFVATGMPVLAGMSRKTMLWKPLGLAPENVLSATVAVHTVAMDRGASIIRVHDVAPAAQARDCITLLRAARRES